MDTCTCDHVDDEHALRPTGPAECTVPGCGCVQFEAAPTPDDDGWSYP